MDQPYAKLLTALSKLSLVEVDFAAFCTSALYYLSRLDGVSAAGIYIPGPYDTQLTMQQVYGSAPTGDMPATEYQQARYVINSMIPVFVDDLRTEDRFEVWPPLLDTDLRAAILARFHTMQGRFGLLAIYSDEVGAYDDDLREFAQAAANMVALALERSGAAFTQTIYLLDYVSDIVFIISRDWHYIYANLAASRATRASKGDLIGQRLVEIYDDLDPDHLALYEEVMTGRQSRRFKASHILPKGVRNDYAVQVYPVPEGIMCIARPTTEETPFTEREQRLLAETMQDIVMLLNANLERSHVLRQIVAQTARVVPHQAAAIVLMDEFQVVEEGTPLFVDHSPEALAPLTEQDGTILQPPEGLSLPSWVASFLAVPIRLNRVVIGFLCLGSEAAGYYSVTHARRLYVYATQTAVALWNATLIESEGREREISKTLQETAQAMGNLGHLTEMLDLTLEQANRVVPYDWAGVWLLEGADIQLEAAQGDVPPLEPDTLLDIAHHHEVVQAEGWVGLPLRQGPKAVGVLGLGNGPFSERNMNALVSISRQAALGILNVRMVNELEAKVAALEVARLSAERSARLSSMGEMAMGIAHQINNPLTAVLTQASVVEYLLADTGHDKVLHSIGAIKKAARRAAGIVNRLFDIGRGQDFVIAPVDIHASIKETASIVRAQLDPERTTLELNLATDLPIIKGSPRHLEDVWVNLMLNARDAVSENAEGYIGVEAWFDDPYIIVTIADNGEGIPPEYLDEIFAPFFTTKSRGTGLGLSICYDAISKHGGEIYVESKHGQGTTFIVRLPTLGE